jgi:hypothetical protein
MRRVALLLCLGMLCAGGRGAALAAGETFADPFAYCAAVGTIDAPDARYTGARMPESIARGLKQALGAPAGAPLTPFLEHSFWRCMDGQVYACTVGANIPCQEKADTNRTPTAAMADFCRSRPGQDVIPAYVTGRATVYLWRCADGTPQTVRTVTTADPRGFLASAWHRIPPPGSE